MDCGNCGRENRPDARFCSRCGTPLARSCAACDRELAPDARFCDGCGAPVDASAAVAPDGGDAVRKTVTALFCDLVGSTAFGERVDAESAREAMGRYHAMARSVIEAHDGTVAKFIGDGVMALFGVPEVGPDDAERAVRAGLALQAGFGEIRDHIAERHGVGVGLRVGVNTGEVVIADDDADIVGDALNTAARLEAACEPGRVLVGESTYRLARAGFDFAEQGRIAAKGKDEPVVAFEVVEAHDELDEAAELTTPFVGRDDELLRLRRVLEDTILERRAALVTVVGSPGVGKTRLAREMRAAVEGGTRAFELRCERSGTATFAPIAELLRTVAGITDAHTVDEMTGRVQAVVAGLDDAERVGELLCGFVGAAPMRSTEEMFLAVRRLFEVLGAEQPVVLVVDDVQWAEPLFLDLLEHLAEWVQAVPLLVVCLARPEIRDVRAVLAEKGRRVAEVVNLEGLSDEATSELAARLVGAESLPGELLARIPASTEGNPLFVRELMRMLVDDGVISDASGRWQMTIDVEAVEVPPTIHSLLASRVERMSPGERRILELASVVGSEFPIGAVEAAGDQSRAELEDRFERLRRKELIESTGSYWGDEPVYRFHHVLIRDAAYRRLLKGARAELHTAVGEWTERTAAALVGEHEVTIAHHFEQAHHYRHELDLTDDETRTLGQRAARLLRVAAERALEREDLAAAASLARRALACVDDHDDGIAELLLLGCEAVLDVGNVADGAPLVDRLASVADGDPRLRAWVDCFRVQLGVLTDPDGLHDAERLADDAARRLEELGDAAGVAKARIQRAAALVRLARVGECEAELDLALSAARAVDDRRRVTAVLGNAPVAALWGPSPVPRAGGRCLDVVRLLRITTGSPAVEATSIRCQAVLEGLRGRHDTARSMLATARSAVEELGLSHDLLETEYYAGLVELLAGEPAAAEPLLRKAYDGLGRMGIGADSGQAGGHLARALLLQDRLDEAEEVVVASEGLAGQNLQTAIVSRSVHAEILSARGRHDEALTLADEAVAAAAGSDILVDHADAVAARARVLAAAGDSAEAATAAEAANALYEQKGATITVDLGLSVAVDRSESEAVPSSPRRTADDWGPGHACLVRSLESMLGGRLDDWSATLTEDVVWDDRRTGARLQIEGREAAVAAWVAGFRGDPQAITVTTEPIAVRGDDLTLLAAHLDNGRDANFAIDALVLGRSVGAAEIDLAMTFDHDDHEGALRELDRLHAETLGPAEAMWVRQLGEYQAAVGRGDLDTLLHTTAPDLVAVDHRNASWPRQNYDAWVERLHSLLDAASGVTGVAERIHLIGPHLLLFTQVWRWRDDSGGEQVSRFLALTAGNPATGLSSRNEFFEVDDLERAMRRIDELEQERSGEAAPNLATSIGGVVNAAVRGGRPVDGLVVDAARLDREPHGFGVVERRLLATAGDHLALLEVELDDGTWAFTVEEVDAEGRLVGWRRFGADRLKEAADHLGERFASLHASPVWTAASALAAAMRAFDAVALVDATTDDYASVDHRRLGYPPLTRADLVELAGDPPPNRPVLLPVAVLASGPAAVVSRTAMYDGEAGSLAEGFAAITVTSVRDGRAARTDHYADADVDTAMARFRELSGEPPTDGPATDEPAVEEAWNRADALTREWATTSDVAELLGPGVEFEDRRRLVAEPGDERIVLTSMRENVAAQHVQSVETVAVRGDLLSLHRMTWHSDDGRDLEWELLTVAEFSEDGHPARAVVFEVEQLAEAVAELARMHCDTLPLADALRFDHAIERPYRELADGELDRFVSRIHPDYYIVDHRLLGFEDGGREASLERIRSLPEVADRIVAFAERVHRLDQYGAVLDVRYRVDTGEGATLSQRYSFFQGWAEWGGLLRSEQFDEGEHERAIAAFDAWCSAQRRRPLPTLASQVATHLNMEMAMARSRVEAFVADPERLRATRPQPFGGTEGRVLATAGALLALLEVRLDDGTWAFVVVEVDEAGLLTDWRVFPGDRLRDGTRHLLDRFRVLADDEPHADTLTTTTAYAQAMSAYDLEAHDEVTTEDFVAVDHRQLGFPELTGEDQRAQLERPASGATVLVPVEVLASSSHATLSRIVFYDGEAGALLESMPGFVVLAVRDGKVSRVELFEDDRLEEATARFEELSAPVRMRSLAERCGRRLHELIGERDLDAYAAMLHDDLVWESRRTGASAVMDRSTTLDSVRFLMDVGARGARISRLATLGVRGARLAAFGVSFTSADNVVDLALAMRFDVDGRLVRAVGVDSDDEALAVLDELGAEEDLSPDLVSTATMVIERGEAEDAAIDVVAVRGDEHALVEVTSRRGSELRLVTVAVDGSVAESTAYEVDDLPSALRDLDRRFIEGFGDEAPEGIRSFAAGVATLNPPDPEALVALYADDIVVESFVSLTELVNSDDHADVVATVMATNEGIDSIVTKVHRLSDHVVLCSVAQSERKAPGERWSTENLTVVAERDGLLTYFGSWNPEDIDAANARFDELAARPAGRDRPSELVNLAYEASLRSLEAMRADDPDAYRAAYHPDARFVGHRHLHSARNRDVEQLLADNVALRNAGTNFAEAGMRPLAIRGERLLLYEMWAPSGTWEMSLLWVSEVDHDGLIVFGSFYDPEDFADAHAELDQRFIEGEGAPFRQVLESIATINDELNRRRIDAQLAAMPDDLVAVDHRALGWGEQDKAGMADRLREGIALSGSARSVIQRFVRIAPDAVLYECAIVRTTADGSEALSEYLMLASVDADGICNRCEQFGPDQLDEARARFDELVAESGD